jgi:hypothetical protein
MDVFVIPVGSTRYELYCEVADASPTEQEAPPAGFFGQLRHKFAVMLKAAEERQHRRRAGEDLEAKGFMGRIQDRCMAWVVERIAEQRLLWHLRRQTTAVAIYPDDMTFEQAMTLIRRILRRDYERHKVWLVVDSLGLALSLLLVVLPGPNIVGYYFAFRVVGHWLSMRGAAQGLERVTWEDCPSSELTILRRVAMLDPGEREHEVTAVAERLRLQHLITFFDRVAIPRP